MGSLAHGLNGELHPVWCYSIYDLQKSKQVTKVCQGGLEPDTNVLCLINRNNIEHLVSIGDVNADNISDFITGPSSYSTSGNCTSIYLGQKQINTTVKELNTSFTLSDPAPHPINDNSRLKIQIQNPGIYTLLIQNSRGQVYAPLFEGNLQAGEQIIPLQINDFSAGAYILILQDAGKKVIGSRTIIIE
jgi:hypothetical protein